MKYSKTTIYLFCVIFIITLISTIYLKINEVHSYKERHHSRIICFETMKENPKSTALLYVGGFLLFGLYIKDRISK